jgi:hypothetical protein
MISFDPLTIGLGALIYLAFRKHGDTQFGVLTPERQEVYVNALEHCNDPERLRNLAVEFEKFGLKTEGVMLRKRADWRGRSPQQKMQHDAVFKKAMASTNVAAIQEVAKAFESLTATVKAKQLRDHAENIQKATAEAAVKAVASKANGVVSIHKNTPEKPSAESLAEDT